MPALLTDEEHERHENNYSDETYRAHEHEKGLLGLFLRRHV